MDIDIHHQVWHSVTFLNCTHPIQVTTAAFLFCEKFYRFETLKWFIDEKAHAVVLVAKAFWISI